MSIKDDNESIHSFFSDYEDPCFISVPKLELAVRETLGVQCHLQKLTEGGNHKIYDIVITGEAEIKYIVRIPSPDFPVDKLESEVATLQYIGANTSVPVPKVIAWSSDPSNSAGTEYMILEKLPGVSADDVWDTLKMEAKETLIRDVAKHLLSLFSLRFAQAGSLYSAQGNSVQVGPLITTPFFRAPDGEIRFPNSAPLDLSQFRGPFTRPADRISSSLKAELYVVKHRRDEVLQECDGNEKKLERAERVLQDAIRLAEVYPGNLAIGCSSDHLAEPFSIMLDDFRPGNVMIEEETGEVTGFIDFEGTTTAPLWMCARRPYWIEDDDDDDETEAKDENAHLRNIFDETIKAQGKIGEEWLEVSEKGRLFRWFSSKLDYNAPVWASLDRWVDERLAFAAEHPGVGLREKTIDEDIQERYGG